MLAATPVLIMVDAKMGGMGVDSKMGAMLVDVKMTCMLA